MKHTVKVNRQWFLIITENFKCLACQIFHPFFYDYTSILPKTYSVQHTRLEKKFLQKFRLVYGNFLVKKRRTGSPGIHSYSAGDKNSGETRLRKLLVHYILLMRWTKYIHELISVYSIAVLERHEIFLG